MIKYIGSKRRLVPVLRELFVRSGARTALDLFTGTTRVAQAFNRTGATVERFARRNAANRDANVGATAVTSAFTPAMDVLATLATAIVAGYGGYLALNGLASAGVVVAFLVYVQQFFRPIQQLSTFYTTVQAALAGAERIWELVDTPPDLVDAPGARALPRIEGRVVFDHVWFSYGDRPGIPMPGPSAGGRSHVSRVGPALVPSPSGGGPGRGNRPTAVCTADTSVPFPGATPRATGIVQSMFVAIQGMAGVAASGAPLAFSANEASASSRQPTDGSNPCTTASGPSG